METAVGIEPKTEFGKNLIEFAQKLDRWCEAETNVTHRQARVAVGLAVIGGAAVIAGWDNAMDRMIGNRHLFFMAGGEGSLNNFRPDTHLLDVVKGLVNGPVEVIEYRGLDRVSEFTLDLSREQRKNALDALLKIEGRQAIKQLTSEMAFLAGIGAVVVGGLLGSNEKVKGSTGVGQWAAGVIKSICKVL